MNDAALIEAAAREAGGLALRLRTAGLKTEWKANNSPVTDADLALDALLTERLRAARPDYGWLSEETADDAERLARRKLFVVDPIDGTRAYVKNKPWFAVCIAVVEDGWVTHGVVHAPELDETFTAVKGGGAFRNGAPITASACDAVEGCAVLAAPELFGFKGWRRPWPKMRVETRNSIAYRMCLVADGRFDAAIALNVKFDWDVAAASLIAEEAGAWVGDHLGRAYAFNRPVAEQTSLVCAAPALAPLILERTAGIDLDASRVARELRVYPDDRHPGRL